MDAKLNAKNVGLSSDDFVDNYSKYLIRVYAELKAESPENGTAIEGTLSLLQELSESVRKEVKFQALWNSISSFCATLDEGETDMERRGAVAKWHSTKSLLLRFGLYGWIEDLAMSCSFLGYGKGGLLMGQPTEQDIKSIEEGIAETKSMNEALLEFQESINIDTLSTIVCVAEEALSSCDDVPLMPQIAQIRILLGNVYVMLYFKQRSAIQLYQAIAQFEEVVRLSTNHHSLACTSLTSLVHIACMRYMECRCPEAWAEIGHYFSKAAAQDRAGVESLVIGMQLEAGASNEAQFQQAIASFSTSLSHRTAPHPQRPYSLNALANALSARFGRKGNLQDLEECILLNKELVNLRTVPHLLCASALNNLANALSSRFRTLGSFQDLEDSITLHRKSLKLQPADDPDRFSSLNNLAGSLILRFQQQADEKDLDEAILLHRESVIPTSNHRPRSGYICNLAVALAIRFREKSDLNDLDECIALHRKAMDLRPAPHPDRHFSLNNLGVALSNRFRHQGNLQDLQECITVHQEALDLAPSGHQERPLSLLNLSNALRARFWQKGDINSDDNEQCVMLLRELVRLLPSSHPQHPSSLTSLGTVLHDRFQNKGDLRDLEESIMLLREAMLSQPLVHLDRPVTLQNLGKALLNRFESKVDFEDLEESIALQREALRSRPPSHSHRPPSLRALSSALSRRFQHKHDLQDIEECIALCREALSLLPAGHTERGASLRDLEKVLSLRSDHTGDPSDIDARVLHLREAAELEPNDPASLNNLAAALSRRYELRCQSEDLEECMPLYSQALSLLSDNHPYRQVTLRNLATFMRWRFEHQGKVEDLEDSLHFYKAASTFDTGLLFDRFYTSRVWAMFALKHNSASALEAHQCAIDLLQKIVSVDLTLEQRQAVLKNGRHLVSDAVKCAVDESQLEMAVLFLSIGRSLFWSQALQLRTPADELAITHPGLAEKFRSISRQLEQASYSSQDHPRSFHLNSSSGQELRPYTCIYNLADQRNKTIEEIRKIKGFEDFLLPPSFQSLQSAATKGPVVILNASEIGCDALIMHASGPVQHVPLPEVQVEELNQLRVLIHMLMTQGSRGTEISEAGVEILERLSSRDMISRQPYQFDHQAAFQFAFGFLWDTVVLPVVKALGLTKTDARTPERIWWCSAGIFAFLPIHAAGNYDEDDKPMDCLFQYAVCSYCTSPQGLLHPPPAISSNFGITAIIEPEASGGPPLPAALDELVNIEKYTANKGQLTARLGLLTAPNQIDDLLSDIQQSSFVHFGCHGCQNLDNPLESYLLLSGGKLTVSRIIKECQVFDGALAYLSACETARGDESRPDESLNLVATMMFAGFRSVVGTMWPIYDNDAPVVADVFYGYLFRDGKDGPPDVGDAAYGLHLAMRELQRRGKPFVSWVPYVHYGI